MTYTVFWWDEYHQTGQDFDANAVYVPVAPQRPAPTKVHLSEAALDHGWPTSGQAAGLAPGLAAGG